MGVSYLWLPSCNDEQKKTVSTNNGETTNQMSKLQNDVDLAPNRDCSHKE